MSSSQRNLATCLLVGGGILAILGQITQVAQPVFERSPAPAILLFIGLALFLIGIISARQESVSAWIERALGRPSRWLDLETWRIAALMISLLLSILTHYAAGDAEKMTSPISSGLAWLFAIGFCMLSLWKTGDFNWRSHWKTFGFALGFTLLALPFRIIATNTIPIILNGDEASAGIYAMEFIRGEANNFFNAGWYAFPGLYFWIPAASISVFGNTTAALRIPSAIAGALTVGGVYLAGRAMFDKRTGILAALALVGFHYHVHFSRIGLNNIWDGLFFILTVLAVWVGWEKENRNAYLLAGLGLGLSQYFYPSSRVLLAVVYGSIILSGLLNFSRLKRSTANILLMTLVMLVIFLPLGWYYIRYPDQYLAPLQRVSILGPWLENEVQITGLPAWKILLKQLSLGVQSFTYLPLQHWYRPEVALLRPIFAGVFLLGVFHLLSRPLNSRSIMLLIWLVIYILIGGLSESTPAAQRYVAAAPVCILVIAHGLSETAALLEKLWQTPQKWVTIALIVIASLMAIDDANFYFNKYTPDTVWMFGHDNNITAQAIADDLMDMPEGTQAFLFGNGNMGYYSIPSIAYLAPQVDGFDVTQPWGAPENPMPTSENLVFIFVPENTADLAVIQDLYPGGTLHEKIAADELPLYWLYEVHVNQ